MTTQYNNDDSVSSKYLLAQQNPSFNQLDTMKMLLNPYVAGNPVGDSLAFVGRMDVLREVLRLLRRPRDSALVLYGQRRIGKTSILQHLSSWLPQQGPYHPISFDLQDKATWSLAQVLQELARAIAYTLDLPSPDLGIDAEKNFQNEWLPSVLDNLQLNGSLVLLFDEFDVLADRKQQQAASTFFPYLRTLMDKEQQRLKFIFVIGRNITDLTTIALSLFKGTDAKRISLLTEGEAINLVRLSEAGDNATLQWQDGAIEKVWQLTNGHPFLTQQICSQVWDRIYDDEPDDIPIVSPADVEAVIDQVLEASRNTLEWLWDGLPPAERVVSSALAEAGPNAIAQEELEKHLQDSGVRVLIRDLQNAPQQLQEWDILEPVDGGYRFRVELLRRWMVEHKPLQRVQQELDYIEPTAQSLYQAAVSVYRNQEFEQAIPWLQQAITLNPNHLGANQLLADIFLTQRQLDDAQQLLERIYEYQPMAARPRLIQVLLLQSENQKNEEEKLMLYERVLGLEPTHPEAATKKRTIWRQRGNEAFDAGNLESALEAYKKVNLVDEVTKVENEQNRQRKVAAIQNLGKLEQAEKFDEALNLSRQLAQQYPDVKNWPNELAQLERQVHLADWYQRALGALQSGDNASARKLLNKVLELSPDYKEANRYLHQALTGIDVLELQSTLEKESVKRENLERSINERSREIQNLRKRFARFIGFISGLILLLILVGGIGIPFLINKLEEAQLESQHTATSTQDVVTLELSNNVTNTATIPTAVSDSNTRVLISEAVTSTLNPTETLTPTSSPRVSVTPTTTHTPSRTVVPTSTTSNLSSITGTPQLQICSGVTIIIDRAGGPGNEDLLGVTIDFRNVTVEYHHIILDVRGADPSDAYIIESEYSLPDRWWGYLIGPHAFTDSGFSPNYSYYYYIQFRDLANETVCIASGYFVY